MPNTYRFPRRAYRRLKDDARASGIMEVCYLLFGNGATIKRVIRVPNRAEDAVCTHVFGIKDFTSARGQMKKRGLHFIACLHTHPVSGAIPGTGDIAGYAVGVLIFIYSKAASELRAFRITKKGRGFTEKKVMIVSRMPVDAARRVPRVAGYERVISEAKCQMNLA